MILVRIFALPQFRSLMKFVCSRLAGPCSRLILIFRSRTSSPGGQMNEMLKECENEPSIHDVMIIMHEA